MNPQDFGAELITSRRNSLVKRLRDLHHAKGRREQGQLLLEGTHLLQEVVRLGLMPAELVATERWLAGHGALVAALPDGVRGHRVAELVLEAAASTAHPDGVVLTLELGALPLPKAPEPTFVLVLDGLQPIQHQHKRGLGRLGQRQRPQLQGEHHPIGMGGGGGGLEHQLGHPMAAHPVRQRRHQGAMARQPALSGHQLRRHQPQPNHLLQQVGAFEQQLALLTAAFGVMEIAQALDQRISPAGDQLGAKVLRVHRLKAVVAAHMHVVVHHDLLAFQIQPLHRGHLPFQALGLEVFNQLFQQDVFQRGLVESVGGQTLKKLPQFGGDHLRGIGNLEDDH